jgi:isopenicillin N synthase-like dioxygenase
MYAGFTTLYQDNIGDLEALNANGEWVAAVPILVTFMVNIGDFVIQISNNRFLSTVHRVKNISRKERHAMPLLFSLNMDAPVRQ